MAMDAKSAKMKLLIGRIRQMAECIADDIMLNGNNEKAERIVLLLPGDRDGGGWSRDALVARIAKMLLQLEGGLATAVPTTASEK